MNANIQPLLAALEQAVAAYNPAVGATVMTIVNIGTQLASEVKASGNDIYDPAQWQVIVNNWKAAKVAMEQSFKDHPGA